LIYRLSEKYLVPPIFTRAISSFAIALLAMTAIGIVLSIFADSWAPSVLENLPKPLSILLGLCGAYAAIGGFFLYVLMWIYLIGFDRTSPLARVGWIIVLLLTLCWGASVYYFVALSRIKGKTESSDPRSK
jgi:hypothetical protein